MDNTVTLVGGLGRDPELRFTQGGNALCNFGLAVSRRWQVNNEWQEQTSWFDVTCWGTLAENVAQSLVKGSRVIVQGRLDQRSWETDGGEKRSKVEVVADAVGPDLRWATATVERTSRSGAEEAEQPARRSATRNTSRRHADDDQEPF